MLCGCSHIDSFAALVWNHLLSWKIQTGTGSSKKGHKIVSIELQVYLGRASPVEHRGICSTDHCGYDYKFHIVYYRVVCLSVYITKNPFIEQSYIQGQTVIHCLKTLKLTKWERLLCEDISLHI